jgi:hypothetical protein
VADSTGTKSVTVTAGGTASTTYTGSTVTISSDVLGYTVSIQKSGDRDWTVTVKNSSDGLHPDWDIK